MANPATLLIIFRQPGANIIETVDRIYAELPSVAVPSIPAGIDTTVAIDRTITIRASVHDVERTLTISVVLVVFVVFIFLRSGRATLIPSVAVPISLIGTFAVMYLLGFSLDNLSLMALPISTGFVVDDAIVVMENISRHIEDGMSPMAATLQGAKEIGFTVFSISMSLIAVFIPILAMGGIVGRLFREFAITLSTAILVSMVISLTTTPMMCAYILKDQKHAKHGRLYRASERAFDGMLSLYRRSLSWVIKNPGPTMLVLFFTVILNFVLIIKIPKGFFPQQDTGVVFGGVQGPQDASFAVMNDSVQQIVKVIKSDRATNHIVAFTGGQGATNGGFIFMSLKPLNERKGTTALDFLGHVRKIWRRYRWHRPSFSRRRISASVAVEATRFYQYTIQSDTTADLYKWGPILLNEMKKLPGFLDVNTDQQNGGLAELINYDRVTAGRLGITSQALDNTLYSAFGQSQVSLIYTQLNQYYVVLEVAPPYWQDPSALNNIYMNTSSHGVIPFRAITTAAPNTTPLTVNHTGLFPSVTVSFNLASGLSLSDATREIDELKQRLGTPNTVRGFFSGTLQAFQASLSTQKYLITTAILAVYIVLGILYESLVHPLTILSTIPSASVGAVLALMLFKIDLNVISIIGIILLIGIVKKNAIMMIDFALVAEREHGKNPADAIFEACMLRFRPILMTTMAALFGALPLAFGTGTGSELRRPLGITIVGGLIVSQMLTLYTTPVVYLMLDWVRLWVQGKPHGEFHRPPDLQDPENATS